jgi:hypothetical protein
LVLWVLLASLIGGGIYLYSLTQGDPRGEGAALPDESETAKLRGGAAPQKAAAGVEVVVQTDVEAGELVVDGESHGPATDGRWVLSLSPGPHRLEARAAGTTVTSSTVAVRQGVPATVLLSLPEGADTLVDAQVAEVDEEAEKKRVESEEREARRERRKQREHAEHQAQAAAAAELAARPKPESAARDASVAPASK